MQKVVWGAPSFWIERFPLYWVIDQGFFANQGIDLEIWYAYGGPELARVVSNGRIHIGILSSGSCDDYFIRKMLSAHEIDPAGDVELIPLGEDYGKLDLFVDGRVDAAYVVEPQLARGEQEGLLRIIDRVADYFPHYQWGIVLASEVWLQHQGELLGRLMHAFRQACRSIRDQPGRTADLGSHVFGVTPEVFKRALQRDLPRWETDARLDMAGLQSALKVQETMGMPTVDLWLDEMVSQL